MKLNALLAASALPVLAMAMPAVAVAQMVPSSSANPTAGSAQDQTRSTSTAVDLNRDPNSSPRTAPQDEPVPAQTVNADGTVSGDANGTVVVTGSRVRLRNLQELQPTITIDRQYLEERNLTNVADALNEQPAFRGSITPLGAQGSFNQGVNFANNLGLGSNRTLTLVNGERFVTSNVPTQFQSASAGDQVDLNVINSLLVDHIDTIDVGGSTVYGSDAISGTVNVILRNRFNGFTSQITSGISERGDSGHQSASFLAGHDFLGGRLNITAAYQHDHQGGLLQNDRTFYQQNPGGATNPSTAQAAALGRAGGITSLNDGRLNTGFGFNDTATDGNPGTVQVRDLRIYYLTQGGLITSATGNAAAAMNYQFDPSGNLVRFNRGIPFVGINSSGGDGFRFSDYSQINTPLTRNIGNLFLSYDASDALKFYAEGEYFHSVADQLVAQPTFNSNLFGGSSEQLTFLTTSPFLTAQARQQLTALGITRFQVSRASVDLADVSGRSETDLARGVLGVRGDFKIGDRAFNYNAYVNHGETRVHDTRQDLNAQNFTNAVNVTTDATGKIVCNANVTAANSALTGFAPVADPACVPLNPLGFGQPSAAARAYVIASNDTRSLVTQTDFVANVGGSPLSLIGNDVGFSAGYEHRRESGSFTPSSFQQQGLGRSVAILPTSGRYIVDEAYGELVAPIVTPNNNFRYLNTLTLNGSGRYVHNTVNGGFFAWTAGGRIGVIKDLTFRGNYTRSFRAPGITELFLPLSSSFATVPDLCSPANRNAGAAPALRARNCAAFLAAFPNATPLDAAAATVPAQSGGNSTLRNEVSNSWTFGAILQPRYVRGLTISADWIHYNITDPITNLSVATIASGCFDNADFNLNDPANGNNFCSQIRRYAQGQGGAAANGGNRGGQVVVDPANPGVTSGFVNGKRILFSAIQGSVNYTTLLTGVGLPGRFEFNTDILYVRRRLIDTTGVAPVRTDGIFGDPKFQFQSNIRYIGEVVGGSVSVNFIGQQSAVRTALSTDLREFNNLDSYATVNSSIFFNVQKRFRLTLSVTNVFDRIGQQYFGYYPTALISDAIGRRYTAGVRANF